MSRSGNELTSSVTADQYRWYFNGSLKETTNDSKLKPDSNGYYQVQLVSEFGCESELSESLQVGFASIAELNRQLQFMVYPNPSNGNFTIEVVTATDYSVEVYDMLGKLILTEARASNIHIDQKGSYIIRITSGDKVGSKVVTVE